MRRLFFVLLKLGCQGGRVADRFCAVASCDSCVAPLCFMAFKKQWCRAAFLVLVNLRLRNIAMRGPWLFFPSQSFPAGVHKKRLRAWSSFILITSLLSSLLLVRAPQMMFIFPGLVQCIPLSAIGIDWKKIGIIEESLAGLAIAIKKIIGHCV